MLTAYTDLLVERGIRGATLEELARRTGLSKSGVLHHFPSMKALRSALFDEVRAQVAEDVRAMRAAPEGPLRYYLLSSLDRDSELERLIEACTRIAQTGDETALDILRESRGGWLNVLVESTRSPALSKTILMLGDGINHNALLRVREDEEFLTDAHLEHLIATFEALLSDNTPH
ncbi:TetR/AcrR family transcriptional regulator [Microbacterium azadirachtae]|uniref:TetR/AcrR family transcriptional regulator n=1 Tax=Microbacterium azadirachtae TaxID=582680 RepID=UPI00158799D0|nr:TetR/AcrR family transcriptional regulator [Microbacterium azadirachtae]